jgi:hypothetical protein
MERPSACCMRPDHDRHTEPCGCVFLRVDVPDDQWIGVGWEWITQCDRHAGQVA